MTMRFKELLRELLVRASDSDFDVALNAYTAAIRDMRAKWISNVTAYDSFIESLKRVQSYPSSDISSSISQA
jgi:hypothetical protein